MTEPIPPRPHDPSFTLAIPRVSESGALDERPDLTVEGRTALIIPVSGLGDKTEQWRLRADPVAPGVPAHITVLVPFLGMDLITDADLERLRAEFARATVAHDVVFDRIRSFPTAVWLAPADPTPFVELTERIHAHWPDFPPYEGKFDEVVPHLTVAHGTDLENLVRLDLTEDLPLTGQIEAVHLYAWTEGHWADRARFPLGG